MICFLVYSRDRKGRITVLGPVFATQEDASAEVERLNREGWNASWVGLTKESRYIA